MRESDIIATMTVHYTSEGEGQVAAAANTVVAAQDKVSASANALATATDTTARRQASAAAAFNAMAKAMDPAARAFDTLERNQNTFGRAMSANSGILDKAGQSLAVYRDKLDAAAVAAENLRRQQANASVNLGTGFNPSAAPTASYAAMFDNLLEIAEGKARQAGQAFGASLDASMIAGVAKSARDSASVFTAELDRLDSIAQAKAMQVGQQFGTSLDENMIAGVSKSAKESASVFTAEMDRLDTIAQQKAMQIGKNFQDDLNKSFGIGGGSKSARDSAAVFEESAKAMDDMAASATRLRAAINPLEAEQGKLAAEMRQYKVALDAGAISQQEFAAAHAMAGKRLGDFAQNLKVAGTAGRVMSGEMTNLGFQLNDVVTGLALGQSPFMILAQQGGQITQIFLNSQSSIADFAKSSLSWFSSLFTAARVTFGGIAAVVLTGASAFASYMESQREISLALTGLGRQSGVTATQIDAIGTSVSNTSKLTIGQAREAATAFAATGKIGKDNIQAATQATDGLAKALGLDATDAAKMLASALADPAKGMGELNSKVGAFDASMREMISQALRNGDVQQAQALMIQGVTVATQGAIKANESWTDSFTSLWREARRGFDLVGKDIANGLGFGGSTQEKLSVAQSQLAGLQGQGDNVLNVGSNIAAQQQLLEVIKKLKEQKLGEEIAAWNAELDRSATAADNATKALTPQIDQIHKMEEAVKALTLAQNVDLGASGTSSGAQAAALVAAQNQLKILQESQVAAASYNDYIKQIADSYVGVSTNAALQLTSLRDQLKVAQATTEQGKLSAEHAKDYNDARRAGLTAEDASAIANAKTAISMVEIAKRALDWQQAMLGIGPAAERLAESAQATADAYQRAADALVEAAGNQDNLAFGNNTVAPGTQYSSTGGTGAVGGVGGGGRSLGVNPLYASIGGQISTPIDYQRAIQNQVNAGLMTGSVQGAIANVQMFGNTGGAEDATRTLAQLYDLLNSQTNDTATKLTNDQQFLGWLQTQPETIARDQQIVQLYNSIKQLTNSTDANTAATAATLNPLYSQGHGALAIGYYKAATGLEGIVGGNGGTDSTEVRMMLTPGEHIKVTPQGMNDNSRQTTIVQNFYGTSTNNQRRSRRQAYQGFAQSIAAAG